MKKWMKISGLLLLTLLAGITVSAEGIDLPSTNTYALTVNYGVGDDSYTYGTQVTITADVRTNEVFYRWTGDTSVLVSNTASTTITMPSNAVTLNATYVDVLYILTVTSGTGGDSYTNGQQVTITADTSPTNQTFYRWVGDTQYVASVTSATTTVTMPATNISVAATYTNLPGYYTLTVTNGTGSGRYTNGEPVLITASNAPTGQAFDRWTGAVTQLVGSVTSPSNTVIMSTNAVSLTATYTNLPGWNALTVNNGTGDGLYPAGSNVTITANVLTNQAFDRWTGAVQYLTNAAASPAIVTMPAWAITLTATYRPDTNRPTLKITSPVAKAKILATSGAFTIRGTAADNKTVADVLVKLNDDDYVSAETTDGWKTWSLPVELISGTNTILAYSVDSAVNSSLISTVKCTYAETTSFTIQTNGAGRVTLSPKGTPEVGKSYTLTASPANGSSFVDWTGDMPSTNRVIMFTMAPGKTNTANFIDIQKPTVKITYPTTKKSERVVTTGTVVLRGTAADNYGLTNVMYQLYTGEWTNAIPTNGWKNWTAEYSPVPGLNTARVYSVDVNGYTSSISTVVFTYAPGAVIEVQTNGTGTIKPNYNGQVLEIGASYTMTAKAAKTSVFTDWTYSAGASVVTSKTAVTFVMESNLVLTANFSSFSAKAALADVATDMPATPQAAIVVDGSSKDWANVPCSSFRYASVTQEVAVALDGNNIALLLNGCPFDTADNVLVYFKLRLSYGVGDSRHSVDLWTSGSVLYGMVDGQVIAGLEAVLLNGVLEVKLPVEQAPSQVTIEEIGCGMDLGTGTLTEIFRTAPLRQ